MKASKKMPNGLSVQEPQKYEAKPGIPEIKVCLG